MLSALLVGESRLPTDTDYKALQQAHRRLMHSHLSNHTFHIASHIKIVDLLMILPRIPHSSHRRILHIRQAKPARMCPRYPLRKFQ